MCGIAGIYSQTGTAVDIHHITAMNQMLKHRGPDGEGTFVEGSIGLGHRRLAILDASTAGQQPMSYADTRYWITYNGEIYNFIELRDQLRAKGHVFISDSDTEVILAAYTEWGEACQNLFNGMWAFAIWDTSEKKLFLSRDRFGVKPLYYTLQNNHFSFASEIKAFLPLPWFTGAVDANIAARMLQGDTTIDAGSQTLFKDIYQLPAGHSITIQHKNPPQINQWWNTLDNIPQSSADFSQQVETFKELFFDACRLRMRSDVPIGTMLSGGLDSSSILSTISWLRTQHAAMKSISTIRQATEWQKAIVACFAGMENDERKHADIAAGHHNIKPQFFEITAADVIDTFTEAVFSAETINDNINTYWLTYRALKQAGITVTLDGHGADEHLGGYPWHVQTARMDSFVWPFDTAARSSELENTLLDLFPNRALPSSPTVSTHDWIRTPAVLPTQSEDRFFALSKYSSLNRHLHYDIHTASLPGHLHRFDHTAMAHGVEVRAPFLDYRLVTYSLSLPSDAKIAAGFTKRILREAMQGLVAEPIRTRKTKIGFGSPLGEWMKGPMHAFIQDTLSSDFFLHSSISNGPAIQAHMQRCLATGDHHGLKPIFGHVQLAYLQRSFLEKFS